MAIKYILESTPFTNFHVLLMQQPHYFGISSLFFSVQHNSFFKYHFFVYVIDPVTMYLNSNPFYVIDPVTMTAIPFKDYAFSSVNFLDFKLHSAPCFHLRPYFLAFTFTFFHWYSIRSFGSYFWLMSYQLHDIAISSMKVYLLLKLNFFKLMRRNFDLKTSQDSLDFFVSNNRSI